MTTFTQHPPVPQVLREALKDCPELIAELQQSLNRTRLAPGMDREDRTDEFESAIGLMEGKLDTYYIKAAGEFRAAEAKGDAELMAIAREKELLMSSCCHDRSWMDELMVFFRWGQD